MPTQSCCAACRMSQVVISHRPVVCVGLWTTALHVVCVGLWTSALQPLLAWAEAVIPHSHWEATPLFLFGTAGLRVLSPESQGRLLGNIRTALQGSAFRCAHECCRQQCGTCIDRCPNCTSCPREKDRKRRVCVLERHDGGLCAQTQPEAQELLVP